MSSELVSAILSVLARYPGGVVESHVVGTVAHLTRFPHAEVASRLQELILAGVVERTTLPIMARTPAIRLTTYAQHPLS